MSDFSEKLRSLRRKAGYTQAEAGALLGISASAVGMYEQGRREPDLNITQRICELYNIAPDYLMSSGDEPCEINDMIARMKSQLEQSGGIMFDGVPISQTDTEKIFDAMLLAARLIMNRSAENQ